jgi:hypothetical protein
MVLRPFSYARSNSVRGFGARVRGALLVSAAATTALVLAACNSNSTTTASSPAPQANQAPMSSLGAKSLPGQIAVTLPAFPAYYDAHKDVVTVTDAYPKAAASQYHVNYAPSLGSVTPASQPLWYIVNGPAAAGQITVLGSEPGESDYSPLWRTAFVAWKAGTTPKVLTSDNMILDLAKKHELTVKYSNFLVNATVTSVGG